MAPILFKIPLTLPYFGHVALPIYGFGMMLVLAFVFAPWLAWWRARREGLDADVVLDMGFWMFLAGLIGARLVLLHRVLGPGHPQPLGCLPVLEGRDRLLRRHRSAGWSASSPTDGSTRSRSGPTSTRSPRRSRWGSSSAGSAASSTAAATATCAAPLGGLVPGRSPPWVHQVQAGLISQGATASLPLHPTQLYSALDGLVLLVLLTAYYPLRRRDGEVMGLLMVAYPVTRFLIEYLRNDEPAFFAGLTISQTISVGLLLAAACTGPG